MQEQSLLIIWYVNNSSFSDTEEANIIVLQVGTITDAHALQDINDAIAMG